MATDRANERHSSRGQQLAEIPDLPDAGADVVLLDRLGDADGHRLHVPSCQPAVSVQALEYDDEIAGRVEQLRVIEGEPAADVDQ
jgi:hypothetical protein